MALALVRGSDLGACLGVELRREVILSGKVYGQRSPPKLLRWRANSPWAIAAKTGLRGDPTPPSPLNFLPHEFKNLRVPSVVAGTEGTA